MPQECHVMSIRDSALTSLGNISLEMDTARREEQYTENNHPAVNMQRAYAPGAAGIMFSLHNQITKLLPTLQLDIAKLSSSPSSGWTEVVLPPDDPPPPPSRNRSYLNFSQLSKQPTQVNQRWPQFSHSLS